MSWRLSDSPRARFSPRTAPLIRRRSDAYESLRVDYVCVLPAELATGRASLTVDVLKDGWVRVQITNLDCWCDEAGLDGQAGFILVSGDGQGASQRPQDCGPTQAELDAAGISRCR